MFNKKEYDKNWFKTHPEHVKKYNAKQNPKRIRLWFKDKSLLLKENPRIGRCMWCGRNGLTQIHHIKYHKDDPLKDIVELCPSCHAYETWKTRITQ